jgi:hypothetical protein
VTGHFPGGDPIVENSPLPSRAWLQADPDRLDRFAAELDDLVDELCRVRSRQSDLATFRSPSADPATVRAATRLAELADDPVRAVATTIDELRTQAAAARDAARDVRELELTNIARLPEVDR